MAVYAAGLYWLARYLFKTQIIDGSHLLISAGTITLILAVLAALQYLTKQNIGVVPGYFGENLVQGVGESREGGVRVSGTFANSNVFAQVLTFYSSIILAYILFFCGRRRLLIALTFSMISLSIIALSLSRSGILGATFAHMVLYWFWMLKGGKRRGDRLTLLIFLMICGVVAALILISFVDAELIPGISRFLDTDISGRSFSSRIETYSGAIEILQNPRVFFLGVGSGQFYEALAMQNIDIEYKSYIPSDRNFGSVHNWPLLITTEHGFIVLSLYVYALYKTIKKGLFLGKANTRRDAMTGAIALVLAVFYVVPFSFGTAGNTPWLLTPIIFVLAWIQNEYDIRLYRLSTNHRRRYE